jgi:hypothetical protein
MDDAVRSSLDHGQTVEITTIGAKTGRQRRLEIPAELDLRVLSFEGH